MCSPSHQPHMCISLHTSISHPTHYTARSLPVIEWLCMFHRQFGAWLRPTDHSKMTLLMSLSMHFGSHWAMRPGGRGCQPVGGVRGRRRLSAENTFAWICHERDEQVKLFIPLVQRNEHLLVLPRT